MEKQVRLFSASRVLQYGSRIRMASRVLQHARAHAASKLTLPLMFRAD